jgi:hypothetical protein
MKTKEEFKQYRRTNIAEIRRVLFSDDLMGVSISDPDKELKRDFPSVFAQGYIARNPKNHEDKWYIAKDYFDDNFEECRSQASELPSDVCLKCGKNELLFSISEKEEGCAMCNTIQPSISQNLELPNDEKIESWGKEQSKIEPTGAEEFGRIWGAKWMRSLASPLLSSKDARIKELEEAGNQILKWYDDEDDSKAHSTEQWQKAYNQLRKALTPPKPN